MASPNAGRSGRPWARLVALVRSWRRPCGICGQPIDYGLEARLIAAGATPLEAANHPDAFTVDHIRSWAGHPELRTDPGNLRPAHRRCNSAKGAGSDVLSLGARSREW